METTSNITQSIEIIAEQTTICQNKYGDLFSSLTWSSNTNIQCICKDNQNKEIACSQLDENTINSQCTIPKNSERKDWICSCPNGYVEENGIKTDKCLVNAYGSLGITCGPEELRTGTCKRNINKTLGIRNSETTPNPTLMLQDVVLAATSFIGTLIMIALVVMGVKYVRWWFDESASGDLKGNIKKLLIWLFLVIGSYTIIRLIQYVARWY